MHDHTRCESHPLVVVEVACKHARLAITKESTRLTVPKDLDEGIQDILITHSRSIDKFVRKTKKLRCAFRGKFLIRTVNSIYVIMMTGKTPKHFNDEESKSVSFQNGKRIAKEKTTAI